MPATKHATPLTDPLKQEENNVRRPAVTKRRPPRLNAVLGLFVLIFAVIGVIATVVFAVKVIVKTRDTSYLKEDMYYVLLPLTQYAPTAFESVNESEQDALIQAALYRITNRELIRQRQSADYTTPYKTDEFGRTLVPLADVEDAYHELFGNDAVLNCHTFGEDAGSYFAYEYDEAAGLYYVPSSVTTSAYEPVIDTIRRAGSIYKVRVGYVHLQDILVDDNGNNVIDVSRATYFQVYTVKKTDDRFIILSVSDESAA